MADKEQIEALYREMYKAMMEKDTATLNRVHADDFVLTHMTTLSEKTASGCLQQLVLQLTNSSFA